MSKSEVPITREVLAWAIRESGYSPIEVAAELEVAPEDLAAWLSGDALPGVTEVRQLAQLLRRPFATFLLPKPPAAESPSIHFRHMPGAPARALSPNERRFIRRAARLQTMLAWIATEMREPRPKIVRATVDDDPVATATKVRRQLGIDVDTQQHWRSASAAFDGWREAVENVGVTVFLFQLGADNCRGFSIEHETAPVVAINTAWNDEARAYTLLHELGHLVTDTSSACVAAPPAKVSGAWDPAERWCERFAAAVLIPDGTIKNMLAKQFGDARRITDVATVRWLANRFRVSLRAATIRLIELNLASWDLYRELPPAGDAKSRGGGGKGRDRQEIQEDQLGGRAIRLFRQAVESDVVTRSQALSYLDVPDAAFDSLGAPSA